jgi:hypothetical protein
MTTSKKIVFLIGVLLLCSTVVSYSQKSNMQNIQFIPKEFRNVKLGYREGGSNSCSPAFRDEMRTINSITINIPQKIIYKIDSENNVPIIPVCAAYMISLRRGYKYSGISAKTLYIKKIGEKPVYSGEIVDKDESLVMLPPNYNLMVKPHREKVEEAQRYSDDELNEGQASGGYLNINLMEYVEMPFDPGVYEIYLSFSGLESNRMIVEIIINQHLTICTQKTTPPSL